MKTRLHPLFLILALSGFAGAGARGGPAAEFPAPASVKLDGLLGDSIAASYRGRLMHFIQDENSPAIHIFSAEEVAADTTTGWNGEHAGKWLYAASRAANRTGDAELAARVRRVAAYLVSRQEPSGYLGTYPDALRFVVSQKARKASNWDVWNQSCLMLGLLEANKFFPDPSYVNAARKIADLCDRTFTGGSIKVTDCGNHDGLSATILIDPVMELYLATQEPRYLALAKLIMKQSEDEPSIRLVSHSLNGDDVARIADGKIYQLMWNLVGVAKLYEATGDAQYLKIVQQDWQSIHDSHLSLEGGPWGGAAVASAESFDPKDFFSPIGYVETCSIMAWVLMNRELLSITGDAKYASEIERTAYNALIGAEDPNGEDWCYYSYPNGRRFYTEYWMCCKSSGAMALEDLAPVAYDLRNGRHDVAINLYGPGSATLATTAAGKVVLKQATDYPFDGVVHLSVTPEKSAAFTVFVRVPDWASQASVKVNGQAVGGPAAANSYVALKRTWSAGDEVVLDFPMQPVWHRQTSNKPTLARGDFMRYSYAAVTRGPLAYATGLIDGYKSEETIRLPKDNPGAMLTMAAAPASFHGPAISLNPGDRSPLVFLPYYEAGKRENGAWRLTWMQCGAD